MNELEEKIKYLAKIAFDERQHIQTISNDVTRLLRYKELSDAKLTNEYGAAFLSASNVGKGGTIYFDITKTPLSQELKQLLEHNFSLHRDVDVFISEMDTVHLESVLWKLGQIQDKVISLIQQEEAELKARQALNLEMGDEETSAKVLQLQRHQVQLDLIQRRRNSISRRSSELIHEIECTAKSIAQVEQKMDASVIEDVPKSPLCYLDVLTADWKENVRIQGKKVVNNRCQNFQALMSARNLPVCDDVYGFLINPNDHANILAIADYTFSPGELASILSFLVMSPSTRGRVHHLSIQNCGVNDHDCSLITGAITRLPRLHSLSLRNNNISSLGVMTMFTRIWENPSKVALFALNLDGNDIGADGAQSIAQALQALPSLRALSLADNPLSDLGIYYILRASLNHKRRAFREFPCPAVLINEGAEIGDDFRTFISGEGGTKISASFDDEDDDNFEDDEIKADGEESNFENSTINAENNRSDDDLSHASTDSEVERVKVFMSKPFVKRFPFMRAKLRAIGAFKSVASRGNSLTYLNVSNSGLSTFSAKMLAVFITSSYISEVLFSDNEVSFESAVVLSNAIYHSLYLRSLVLQNTYLADHSIKELTQAAAKSKSLLFLDLSRNSIGPAGANWIANSTKELYIDSITVTAANVDKNETSTGRTILELQTNFSVDYANEGDSAAAVPTATKKDATLLTTTMTTGESFPGESNELLDIL